MASLRRLRPLPIPAAELARLKETLHPEYGSQVHEGLGPEGEPERILVVRVPRDDPDMVNDVEAAVEYLNPGDLAEATSCLLVGNHRTLQVATSPLRDLMAARVQFDRRQCHLLRGQLVPGEHRLFKAPEDPRRLVRLAIRFQRARVADVTEEDLAAAARELGPKLSSPAFREVRSVYLVADKDDVRMDADLFFQDASARWGEESERRRLAEEVVARETSMRIKEESEKARRMALERPAASHRVAVAPLRTPAAHAAWDAPADPSRAAMYAHLDALLGLQPGATAAPTAPTPTEDLPSAPPVATGAARPASAPAPAPPRSPHIAPLQAALEAAGFDVLARPGPHGIDVAAERATAFPNRVVAYCPDRLDVPLADRVLLAAKELQVDLALVVCAEADPEARKRFIATRARWVEPAGLADLAF